MLKIWLSYENYFQIFMFDHVQEVGDCCCDIKNLREIVDECWLNVMVLRIWRGIIDVIVSEDIIL